MEGYRPCERYSNGHLVHRSEGSSQSHVPTDDDVFRSATRDQPLRESVQHSVRLLRTAEGRRYSLDVLHHAAASRIRTEDVRDVCALGPSIRVRDWLLPRVLELTYTAWDLKAFAEDCGDDGPPFIWDSERRLQLRSEIDAAFFHLYGISRDDTAYILDTFPVLEKSEIREYGEYRTKRVVLETYDSLAAAAANGIPYDPPLGPPRRAA